MRTTILVVCALAGVFPALIKAQTQPPAAPNFTSVRAEYAAALAALEAEQKPRISAAETVYEAGLRALEQKQMSAKKLDEALAFRAEADRIKDGKPPAALPKSASPEWKALRLAYENQMQEARKPAGFKMRGIRQRYFQQLSAVERSLATPPESAGLAAVRFAKMCFAISEQIEQKAYTTTPGAPTREEIPPQGALLVGFNIGAADLNGITIVKSLQPVFLTTDGEKLGEVYGDGARDHHVVAPPGYAVGGALVKIGNRLDAVSLTFMKIIPGKLALDPSDLKQADWFGNPAGPKARQIGGNGRLVIGIAIQSGADVDALGLVHLR